MAGLPEVSLITSWYEPAPDDQTPLPGLSYALQSGLRLLDLYFLSHSDIRWYISHCSREDWTEDQQSCPLCFAAALKEGDIDELAGFVQLVMAKQYAGRLVGPRPRIAALATYWPLISDDDDEKRKLSVKAVINSLLLARKLGCHHVEIVGGAAFNEKDGGEAAGNGDRAAIADEAVEKRRNALCQSLIEVFGATDDDGESLFPNRHDESVSNGPYLCVEMEPGAAFLVRDVNSFFEVREKLSDHDSVQKRVLLNVDLAHMFLADADDVDAGVPAGEEQLKIIRGRNSESVIGHFHVSDHARTHASDLCPGSYHFFEKDYRPWFQLARELVGSPQFSGVVAVELEACGDLQEATRAIGRTRDWLRAAATKPQSGIHAISTGAVMSVDIINSTEILALGGGASADGAKRIDIAVSSLCRVVQQQRGSVYSFTGDGVVALFDRRDFWSEVGCAQAAQAVSEELFTAMRQALEKEEMWGVQEAEKLGIRVALHWGEAMIPNYGPLKHQSLGASVIIACRLLKDADAFAADESIRAVCSGVYLKKLDQTSQAAWQPIDAEVHKGFAWATERTQINGVYGRQLGEESGVSASS